MSKRSRIAAYGSAALLVIAGAVSVPLVGGGTGQLLALVLIGIGLVAAVSLVFLEVGLSEDRERAHERAREERLSRARSGTRRRRLTRAKLERSRGHRRRLR